METSVEKFIQFELKLDFGNISEQITKKYSDYITYPIKMEHDHEGKIEEHIVIREYRALVHGSVSKNNGVLDFLKSFVSAHELLDEQMVVQVLLAYHIH